MFLQQADTNSKSLLCLHRKAHSATNEAVGDMPPPSGAQQSMILILLVENQNQNCLKNQSVQFVLVPLCSPVVSAGSCLRYTPGNCVSVSVL